MILSENGFLWLGNSDANGVNDFDGLLFFLGSLVTGK